MTRLDKCPGAAGIHLGATGSLSASARFLNDRTGRQAARGAQRTVRLRLSVFRRVRFSGRFYAGCENAVR